MYIRNSPKEEEGIHWYICLENELKCEGFVHSAEYINITCKTDERETCF